MVRSILWIVFCFQVSCIKLEFRKNELDEYTTKDVTIGSRSREVVLKMSFQSSEVGVFSDSACVFANPFRVYDWSFGYSSSTFNASGFVGSDRVFSSSRRMEEIPSYQTIAQGVLGLREDSEILRAFVAEFSFNQSDGVDTISLLITSYLPNRLMGSVAPYRSIFDPKYTFMGRRVSSGTKTILDFELYGVKFPILSLFALVEGGSTPLKLLGHNLIVQSNFKPKGDLAIYLRYGATSVTIPWESLACDPVKEEPIDGYCVTGISGHDENFTVIGEILLRSLESLTVRNGVVTLNKYRHKNIFQPILRTTIGVPTYHAPVLFAVDVPDTLVWLRMYPRDEPLPKLPLYPEGVLGTLMPTSDPLMFRVADATEWELIYVAAGECFANPRWRRSSEGYLELPINRLETHAGGCPIKLSITARGHYIIEQVSMKPGGTLQIRPQTADCDFCMICLEDLTPGDVEMHLPNCQHCLHSHCLTNLMKRHSDCPMCRKSMYPELAAVLPSPLSLSLVNKINMPEKSRSLRYRNVIMAARITSYIMRYFCHLETEATLLTAVICTCQFANSQRGTKHLILAVATALTASEFNLQALGSAILGWSDSLTMDFINSKIYEAIKIMHRNRHVDSFCVSPAEDSRVFVPIIVNAIEEVRKVLGL